MRPARIIRSAIALRPSTLLNLHHSLKTRKYRLLFSAKRRGKPGPKGPSKELIEAVVQMKQLNPTWDCPRISQQIALAFGIQIDKDVVRRILASHYRPKPDAGGPSWLTLIGQLKDSLWSLDLFRCESATLRTHWVLVVMDQYTRRIIGFEVKAGTVNGVALCRSSTSIDSSLKVGHFPGTASFRLRRIMSSRSTFTNPTSSSKKIERAETPQLAVSPFLLTLSWSQPNSGYVTLERDLDLFNRRAQSIPILRSQTLELNQDYWP